MEGLVCLIAFGSTFVTHSAWEKYLDRPRKWYHHIGRACAIFTVVSAILMAGFNFDRLPINVRRTIGIFGAVCSTGVFASIIDNSRY